MVKVVKPKGNNGHKKPPLEEKPFQHEEVDIDEANPEDEKYDPKVIIKLLNLNRRKMFWKEIDYIKYFLLYNLNSITCSCKCYFYLYDNI